MHIYQPATRMRYQHFSFFYRTHVLESLEIIISRRSSTRSEIRDEDWVLRLSPFNIVCSIGPLEYRGWLCPSHEMLTLSLSLSFFFSVFLRFSPALPLPLPFQSIPHLYMCVEVEELQHPPADVSRLAIIVMDRTFCSSPPANQVNPINALGRPQTKKLPPGTLALSRERYVFVLKCPFWSSSSVISTAISNHGK